MVLRICQVYFSSPWPVGIFIFGLLALEVILYFLVRLLFIHEKIVYIRDKENPLVYDDGYITLIGSPDYIKKRGKNYIPHEYKKLKIKSHDAYLSHKLQLASYMLLIEKTFKKRPKYGIITYANNMSFKVDNTPELHRTLSKRIGRLKELKTGRAKPVRNHSIVERCFSCKYCPFCKQRLQTDEKESQKEVRHD